MKSKYQSPNTVGKRQTVPIDVNDPRLKPDKIGRTRARQGAEIQIVDVSSGANLTAVALSQGNAGSGNAATLSPDTPAGALSYIELVNAIVNPGPNDPTGRPNVVNLGSVSNLSATWSGGDLVFSFDFDPNLPQNATVNEFVVHATSSVAKGSLEGRSRNGYFKLDKTKTHHSYTFTQAINSETLGGYTVDFAGFCVYPVDSLGFNIGAEVCIIPPAYVLDLNTPQVTITNANNGYIVAVTNTSELAKSSFTAIDIWEIESSASTEPADTGTNYSRVYLNTINPATIISPNLNQRWVKVRFSSKAEVYTAFTAAIKINPISTISLDLIPPNELTSVSAAWNASNGIDITYTMPQTDPGVRFIVILSPISNISAQGSFYIYPTSTSGTQTLTITKFDLFGQFGTYYTQFTGIIKSVDAADNRTSGVSFNVASITNQLASVTPNPTLTAIIDGYIVSVSNTTANVDHVEVYEYFLDPTTMLDMMGTLMDYMDADYLSGGASGANTIVLNNWQDQMQMSVVNPEYCEGMAITGIGIPYNTYITSITVGPSTNYTVHLSNNLTQQASGSYHMPSLVASGNSPLSVYTGNYIKRWVVVVYYDIFGNNSLFGKANPEYVIPLNPTTSLFDTAVQITSTGALYLGSSKTSVPNVLIGTNSAEAGIFVWGPNDGTTTSDTPSTQIIGAANSPLTFITKNAQIADWLVTDTKIENTLSGTPTKYTGLSATGTYSFWAGSTVTGGNSSAKFTVTPLGAVTAREIYIVGTGDANSKLIDAGSNFYVKHDGSLYATSATITGTITASSGSITGNLTIGTSGALTSGTVGQSSGNAGYILANEGLRFDYGTTQGITQIVGTTGQLITKSASIGSWIIDSYTMSKTTSAGVITLDSGSSSGYLSMYAKSSSGNYTAGFTTNSLASGIALWAGNVTGPANASSAAFKVAYDGTLTATQANIYGTIQSLGTSTIKIDGNGDFISFGTGSGASQLFVRDVTGGKATFLTNSNPINNDYTINNTTLQSKPYLAIGNNTNSYGTIMEGVGLYTSGSYINVTTSNGIGIMTGDTIVRAGIILKDGKVSIGAVDSGLTSITDGANGTITITSSLVQLTARQQRVDLAGYGVSANGSTAYAGKSQITLSRDYGVMISGIPVQKDIDMSVYTGGYYMNMYPLGPYPRQRMIVEDPVTGMLTLGMGVYYSNGVNPVNAGYVGDLWVVY